MGPDFPMNGKEFCVHFFRCCLLMNFSKFPLVDADKAANGNIYFIFFFAIFIIASSLDQHWLLLAQFKRTYMSSRFLYNLVFCFSLNSLSVASAISIIVIFSGNRDAVDDG